MFRVQVFKKLNLHSYILMPECVKCQIWEEPTHLTLQPLFSHKLQKKIHGE